MSGWFPFFETEKWTPLWLEVGSSASEGLGALPWAGHIGVGRDWLSQNLGAWVNCPTRNRLSSHGNSVADALAPERCGQKGKKPLEINGMGN